MAQTTEVSAAIPRQKLIATRDLINNTVADYRANWRKFAVLLLLPLTATFVASLISYAAEAFAMPVAWSWPLALTAFIVLLALIVAFIYWFSLTFISQFLLIKDLSQEASFRNLGEWYGRARPYFWSCVAVTLVYTLLAGLGLVLLVIPGLIFSIYYCLAIYFVIFEDGGFEGAFGRSRELVKGYWWAVFGRFCAGIAVLYLFYLVVGGIFAGIIWLIAEALSLSSSKDLFKVMYDLLSVFIGLAVGPLTMLYVYGIYRSLKEMKNN